MTKNTASKNAAEKCMIEFALTHSSHGALADISVDFLSLPAASQQYLLHYGLRKSLQDSFAAAKTADEAKGFLGKRLDAILAGTVGTRVATPANALDREIRRLAEAQVKERMRRSGIALSKVDKKVFASTVELLISKLGDALRKEAQANLDALARLDVGEDSEDDFMASMMAGLVADVDSGEVEAEWSEPSAAAEAEASE